MLLKKTKQLENKVNNFLDIINDAGPFLVTGLDSYFNDDEEKFDNYLEKLIKLENKADGIRRNIETQLYEKTLIPEARADVLSLLEALDDIIDRISGVIREFNMEIPDIHPKYHKNYLLLSEYAQNAVDQIIRASRYFFNDPVEARHCLPKVYHWEEEADDISGELIRNVFRDPDIGKLSIKLHHRMFVDRIDRVADISEDIADKLSIFTIKRSI